mgnify:CR=1 FL=1
MADPKEDQGKYPATDHRVEAEEAAQRGETPGGKTGLIRTKEPSLGKTDWTTHPKDRAAEQEERQEIWGRGYEYAPSALYGPNDRQRYLQDVADRAFKLQNPEQGPMTAYQASGAASGYGGDYGDKHQEAMTPDDAQSEAHTEMGDRHRLSTWGPDDLVEGDAGVTTNLTPDRVRGMLETQKALEFAAGQRGMSVAELIEALEKSPRERGWDPQYENYTPPEDK